MNVKSLLIQQLDEKLVKLFELNNVQRPAKGWIKSIRRALGMSMKQLGDKLSISKQGVLGLESREMDNTITLKTLNEVANVMDMDLVYAFIPRDGSLESLINRKAKELATIIVLQTSHNMKLEDQENSETRIKKAIEERAAILKTELPKILWD